MPAFGERSQAALATAHPKLRALFEEVVKSYDCRVLCGFRTQAEQDAAVAAGTSKKPWPESKHNTYPSPAVDAVPYPVLWPTPGMSRDELMVAVGRLYAFYGYVRRTAEQMGIHLRCGADWNGNYEIKDQNFHDVPHFELAEERPEIVTA